MKKIALKEDSEKKLPSRNFIKTILKNIGKYKNYEDYLVSVGAMKRYPNRDVVVEYKSDDLNRYESMMIIQHCNDHNDNFIFGDITKKMKVSEGGKMYDSGYFVPRFFYDYILEVAKTVK